MSDEIGKFATCFGKALILIVTIVFIDENGLLVKGLFFLNYYYYSYKSLVMIVITPMILTYPSLRWQHSGYLWWLLFDNSGNKSFKFTPHRIYMYLRLRGVYLLVCCFISSGNFALKKKRQKNDKKENEKEKLKKYKKIRRTKIKERGGLMVETTLWPPGAEPHLAAALSLTHTALSLYYLILSCKIFTFYYLNLFFIIIEPKACNA